MANTTNFGWETPDDTDLVKDGAAAIRTLGSSIDTSLVDLKGGTTGQVLSKATNTDMDFTWVAQDDSNAIQNAIVDAKGDLIAATAADTPARLGVGANGTVLTADSAEATGLKWATPASGMTNPMTTTGDIIYSSSGSTPDRLGIGSTGNVLTVAGGVPSWAAPASGGMTLLSTTSMSGSGTITVSSISSSYNSLYVLIDGWKGSGGSEIFLRINSDTTSPNYTAIVATGNTSLTDNSTRTPYYKKSSLMQLSYATPASSSAGSTTMFFPNYKSGNRKTFNWQSTYADASNSYTDNFFGAWNNTSAINELSFYPGGGTWGGGTIYIYGVK